MIRTFTVVGGGSAYAPGLFAALVHHAPSLDLEEVRLWDVNAPHLELVTRLCQRLAKKAGLSWRVKSATGLEDALRNTDAVLHTTRPGGLECRRIDETLPLEFGIPGQETVGPGGFFFALRSVPVALEIAATLRRVAPDAVFLNYTNPTNIVTQALSGSGVRVLGLCDQSDEDLHSLSISLGLEPKDTAFTCTGLNHATWYDDVRFDGKPLKVNGPLVAPPGLDEEHRLRFELSRQLAVEAGGLWPNSYLPYYTHAGQFVELSRKTGPRSDVIAARLPTYYKHFEEVARADDPVLLHHRGSAGFGDMAVHVLQAVGRPAKQRLVLNVPNAKVAGLDADTVCETLCEVRDDGVHPLPGPKWPERFPGLLEALESYQRLAAEAATRGGEGRMVKALAANPLVPDETVARRMLARARALYGARLPGLA